MFIGKFINTTLDYSKNTFQAGAPAINELLNDKILFIRLPNIDVNSHFSEHAKIIQKMVCNILKSYIWKAGLGLWLLNNICTPRGFAVLPAQARSMGINLVTHYDSKTHMMQLLGVDEADSLLANHNTVLYGYSQDKETNDWLEQQVMRLNYDYYKASYIEKPELQQLNTGEHIIHHQNILEKIKIKEID